LKRKRTKNMGIEAVVGKRFEMEREKTCHEKE
jgi:hypothetical protein